LKILVFPNFWTFIELMILILGFNNPTKLFDHAEWFVCWIKYVCCIILIIFLYILIIDKEQLIILSLPLLHVLIIQSFLHLTTDPHISNYPVTKRHKSGTKRNNLHWSSVLSLSCFLLDSSSLPFPYPYSSIIRLYL
jgi:hypothetical protein